MKKDRQFHEERTKVADEMARGASDLYGTSLRRIRRVTPLSGDDVKDFRRFYPWVSVGDDRLARAWGLALRGKDPLALEWAAIRRLEGRRPCLLRMGPPPAARPFLPAAEELLASGLSPMALTGLGAQGDPGTAAPACPTAIYRGLATDLAWTALWGNRNLAEPPVAMRLAAVPADPRPQAKGAPSTGKKKNTRRIPPTFQGADDVVVGVRGMESWGPIVGEVPGKQGGDAARECWQSHLERLRAEGSGRNAAAFRRLRPGGPWEAAPVRSGHGPGDSARGLACALTDPGDEGARWRSFLGVGADGTDAEWMMVEWYLLPPLSVAYLAATVSDVLSRGWGDRRAVARIDNPRISLFLRCYERALREKGRIGEVLEGLGAGHEGLFGADSRDLFDLGTIAAKALGLHRSRSAKICESCGRPTLVRQGNARSCGAPARTDGEVPRSCWRAQGDDTESIARLKARAIEQCTGEAARAEAKGDAARASQIRELRRGFAVSEADISEWTRSSTAPPREIGRSYRRRAAREARKALKASVQENAAPTEGGSVVGHILATALSYQKWKETVMEYEINYKKTLPNAYRRQECLTFPVDWVVRIDESFDTVELADSSGFSIAARRPAWGAWDATEASLRADRSATPIFASREEGALPADVDTVGE